MRKISIFIMFLLLAGAVSVSAAVKPNYQKIGVEIDGSTLNADAYLIEGRTMVPLRAIFEKLQAEVKWEQKTQSIAAIKGSTTVYLKINDVSAKVNANTMTLDVPPMIIDSSTYVPLRFVSESLGAKVSFDSNRKVAIIQTAGSSSPSSPDNSTGSNTTVLKAEPFVAKGYVKTKDGRPLEGIEVLADDQTNWNRHTTGYTDKNGYYEIELPNIKTAWNIVIYHELTFEGKTLGFNMVPDKDDIFGGDKGVVRNFTWDINGRVVVGMWEYPDDSLPEFSFDDVELTLTPIGPLVDGSQGKAIRDKVEMHPVEGPSLGSIPIGKYEVTAVWMPAGIEPIPMELAPVGTEQYSDSAISSFRNLEASKNIMGFDIRVP